ncbi:MAG: hypothetical protein H6988_08160 [Pseudomonadales bacterium]|jgi:hypothetical protein|nr:hypothetical protein [Anaerolineales bacterium]MCB8916570.1 hypothetical protein [Ardenticatenaceae bacterium]MCP5190354.1 hypothetical protein [Pseudomonadales bacterium]
MSRQEWVVVKDKTCEFQKHQVEQLELRLYPTDFVDGAEPYRVLARKCSDDIACNLAGYPCKWAFTNPAADHFALD